MSNGIKILFSVLICVSIGKKELLMRSMFCFSAVPLFVRRRAEEKRLRYFVLPLSRSVLQSILLLLESSLGLRKLKVCFEDLSTDCCTYLIYSSRMQIIQTLTIPSRGRGFWNFNWSTRGRTSLLLCFLVVSQM